MESQSQEADFLRSTLSQRSTNDSCRVMKLITIIEQIIFTTYEGMVSSPL